MWKRILLMITFLVVGQAGAEGAGDVAKFTKLSKPGMLKRSELCLPQSVAGNVC